MEKVSKKFEVSIKKFDDEQRLAFGWASIAVDADGKEIVDKQDEIIPINVLEKAAYDFALHSGPASDMHEKVNTGRLVESFMVTAEKREALDMGPGQLGWWIGFKVHDDATWKAIKRGERPEFSIEGEGERVAIDAA